MRTVVPEAVTLPKHHRALIDKDDPTEIPFLLPSGMKSVKLGVAICHVYSINGLQYTLRTTARSPLTYGCLCSLFFSFFCPYMGTRRCRWGQIVGAKKCWWEEPQ